MKKTSVISVCGIFSALSIVIMLAAYLGLLTYALPALAGALLIVIYLEFGVKNAVMVYAVVSVLSFLICEKEATLCYTMFFGYYPFVKAYIERLKPKFVQWAVKFLLFTVSFAIVMLLATFVFGIPFGEMSEYGIWGLVVLAVAFEVMFFFYDIALSRVIVLYMLKYRAKFRKLFKLKSK